MSGFYDSLRKQLGYMMSLPERSVRSLAALAGGTTSLLTETLFPESLRGSTLYKTFIGDAQHFVVQKIAQVQRDTPVQDAPAGDRFFQRKMVGSALETAGLLAMHMSPLWVLAMASDAAAGGGVFLNRLVDHLKENGVLPKHTQVSGITDLLVAIQDATRRSTSAVDAPPLSRQELGRLADEMMAGYRQVFSRAGDLLPRLETIWQRMQDLSKRENISVERLSGILSIDVADWAKRGFGAVSAVGQTSSDLLAEKVLESYSRTLDALQKEGVGKYINDRMQPFLKAAIDHFDPGRTTLTESFLASMGEAETPPEAPTAESPKAGDPPGEQAPPPSAPPSPPVL